MNVPNLEALYALAGVQSSEPRAIANENFSGVQFTRLLIGPGTPPESAVRMSNCSFHNCSVAGEFRVAPGVELANVLFDNVSSPDLMTLNTETVLRNVTIKGSSKLRGLWVKPASFTDPQRKIRCQNWSAAASAGVEFMLDFSEFFGEETEVVGLPLSKLKWNDEYHVPLLLAWKASEEWRQIGLPLTSYWALRMKRLQDFDATEGVYSLPHPKSKNYAQAKEEMTRLIEVGLLRDV